MKRDRPRRSSGSATIGDALSSSVKGQLHQLRETLEKLAKETIARQLDEARPWRRPQTGTAIRKAKTRPSPSVSQRSVTSTRQLPRQVNPTHRVKPKAPEMHKPAPKPSKPAFEYWDFPKELAVREAPPTSISDAERAEFEDLIQADAQSRSAEGEDLFIIAGLDFGTSCTKIIIRLPYEAGEPAIAIPAPAPCHSGDNPYLWQTVLWLQEDGSFLPWPSADATVLHALKQGLIQGRSDAETSGTRSANRATRAQAGVAYLAFAIRYVRGWLFRNRPDLLRGRRPVWFVNLGMPTASYDDPQLAKPYRRIGAAALQLAKIESPISIEAAQCFLDESHVIEAGASEEVAEELGVAVFPEAAAEMTGFVKSTRNAPGLYLLVDVGAMTLDACMFRLNPGTDMSYVYSFLNAQVRPLGVESFHWFLGEGKTESEFIQQCDRTLRGVVWQARRDRDPNAQNWKSGHDVPVFLAGGGASNGLHQGIVASLGPWLTHHLGNDGIRLLELPVPSAIEFPVPLEDFGRMAVAWGLSHLPTDIGRIRAMRDIEDVPPPVPVDWSGRYVSKDQV